METQVQQKTMQLQGLDTLLSEAEALGLAAAETHSTAETTSVVNPPVPPALTATGASDVSTLEPLPTENGSTSPGAATAPVMTAIGALSVKKPSKQSRGQQGKGEQAKASSDSKSSASIKNSTLPAKLPKPSTPSAGKTNQRGRTSGLQQFLKSQWRDKALTEVVSDILNRAAAPMSTDEVMAALYDGLPKDDYDRAKHSLANILSVGRSKGAWQSKGRGRYAGKAVTTAAVGVHTESRV